MGQKRRQQNGPTQTHSIPSKAPIALAPSLSNLITISSHLALNPSSQRAAFHLTQLSTLIALSSELSPLLTLSTISLNTPLPSSSLFSSPDADASKQNTSSKSAAVQATALLTAAGLTLSFGVPAASASGTR